MRQNSVSTVSETMTLGACTTVLRVEPKRASLSGPVW